MRSFLNENLFSQRAFDFNAVNHQNSHYYARQGILQCILCCQSVNMAKNFRSNLASYYGGWVTAVD